MENGTYLYDLCMSVPLGKRRGELQLIVEDHFLNGYLTMFSRTIPIRNTQRTGNQISFAGEMITLMNTIPYKAVGSVAKDRIELEIMTERGNYSAFGMLAEKR